MFSLGHVEKENNQKMETTAKKENTKSKQSLLSKFLMTLEFIRIILSVAFFIELVMIAGISAKRVRLD